MSEDKIKIVQSLIDSNKADTNRLQQILSTLQQGRILDVLDQNYLDEISKELQAVDVSEHLASEDLGIQEPPSTQVQQNDADVPPDDTAIHKTKGLSSRKKVLVIVTIIVAMVASFVGLDAYSASMLQFRPDLNNQYQVSSTAIHIQANVCNPSFFPATFNKYTITAFYNSEEIEDAEINGTTVYPNTATTVDGIFALNADALLKLRNENATFDPTLAKITTNINAPIFGTIPFSVIKEYSSEQFQQVLKNGPSGSFSCR